MKDSAIQPDAAGCIELDAYLALVGQAETVDWLGFVPPLQSPAIARPSGLGHAEATVLSDGCGWLASRSVPGAADRRIRACH